MKAPFLPSPSPPALVTGPTSASLAPSQLVTGPLPLGLGVESYAHRLLSALPSRTRTRIKASGRALL